MSTPNKYQPPINVPPPHCPHCGTAIDEIRTFQWTKQLGIGVALIFCTYCPSAECLKLIGQQILVVPNAQEQSAIARPS